MIFIAHTFHQEPVKSSPCRLTFPGLIFVLNFIAYHMFRAWDYFVDLPRIQNVTRKIEKEQLTTNCGQEIYKYCKGTVWFARNSGGA